MRPDYILAGVQTSARDHAPVATLIVLLHLLCSALWSLSVPAFETPDEPGHARYINFLSQSGRLPRPGEEAPGEAHQPPLYYALGAAAARLAGLAAIDVSPVRNPGFRWYGGSEENKYLHADSESPPLSGRNRALHWLRLLFLPLGAGTVALVFVMGTRCGGSPAQAAMAASFVAFLPQFTFISGSLNNDNLANLLATGSLACLAAGIARPGRIAPWAGAGLLAGLGLLTKFTGFMLLPCGMLALVLARRAARRQAAAFFLPALALPLPLLARNLLVLGDPLGAAAQVETLPQLLDRKTLISSYFFTEFPSVMFRSFWGTFGWMSFRLPASFYVACLVVTLAGLAGLALMRRDETTRKLHLLFSGAVVVQVAQIAIYNLTFTQAQGRFLFPVIGPIALLLVSGLAESGCRSGLRPLRPGWIYLSVVALAAVNLCILRLIVLPAYHSG